MLGEAATEKRRPLSSSRAGRRRGEGRQTPAAAIAEQEEIASKKGSSGEPGARQGSSAAV